MGDGAKVEGVAGAGPTGGENPWLIGWKEALDLPEWGVAGVKAKIDTGARTSALDVAHYELRETEAGVWLAELHLALDRKDPERLVCIQTPVLKLVMVANSSGVREQRPLVETTIRLGPVSKTIQLTVTNRTRMLFPMILGRTALAGDFVVDVSRKYVLSQRPRRRRRGWPH